MLEWNAFRTSRDSVANAARSAMRMPCLPSMAPSSEMRRSLWSWHCFSECTRRMMGLKLGAHLDWAVSQSGIEQWAILLWICFPLWVMNTRVSGRLPECRSKVILENRQSWMMKLVGRQKYVYLSISDKIMVPCPNHFRQLLPLSLSLTQSRLPLWRFINPSKNNSNNRCISNHQIKAIRSIHSMEHSGHHILSGASGALTQSKLTPVRRRRSLEYIT